MINSEKALAGFVVILVTIGLFFVLMGCSAQYHLNKFQNKGGVCGKVDTIKVMKYDTITQRYYYQDSLILVNERVVPMTRTEVRYLTKIHRDTIKLRETEIKYLYKQQKQEQKAEVKKQRAKASPFKFLMVILLVLALIVIAFKFAK